MDERLVNIVKQVQRPARYIGKEHNAVIKEWVRGRLRVALAFPDLYDVGMSYLGMKILYGILNEREDVLCERVFAPWPDMEKALRDAAYPLYGLESKRPLSDFDVVGFSFTYELNYTNALTMLELGGIPKGSRERTARDPIVIAGGPSCYNPEPFADFIDAFLIGDGEEAISEIADLCCRHRRETVAGERVYPDRPGLLRELAAIEGVYVPSLYDVRYHEDGTIERFEPKAGAPERVRKRIVRDLDLAYYPTAQVVPYIQIVHDRIVLEVMRGCPHLCAFCEAGTTCLPKRERSRAVILDLAIKTYQKTGYEEISLVSLSTGDHSAILGIFADLQAAFREKAVSVSMPSLRIEEITESLPRLMKEVRKAGLTFAPETGSDRLRKVIRKEIDSEKLLAASLQAYKAGWDRIKLYFMVGLPTETDEDLAATARLIEAVSWKRRETGQRPGMVVASVAAFVPKPHTALQWRAMESQEVIKARQAYLKNALKRHRHVKLDFHDIDTSFLEGVISRGDRRLGGVIAASQAAGARFDGWREFFRIDRWRSALASLSLTPEFYANRARSPHEVLPWDHIDIGISKEQLLCLWRSAGV